MAQQQHCWGCKQEFISRGAGNYFCYDCRSEDYAIVTKAREELGTAGFTTSPLTRPLTQAHVTAELGGPEDSSANAH